MFAGVGVPLPLSRKGAVALRAGCPPSFQFGNFHIIFFNIKIEVKTAELQARVWHDDATPSSELVACSRSSGDAPRLRPRRRGASEPRNRDGSHRNVFRRDRSLHRRGRADCDGLR